MRVLEWIWFAFFLLGWLLLGVLGTWATTPPFWYGAACLAVAGAGCLLAPQGAMKSKVSRSCLAAILLFWAYVAGRALTSEVVWLARQDLVFSTAGLIAYLLVALRFTSDRHRALLLSVWGLLVLANVVIGSWQYFEDPTWNVLQGFGWNRSAERSAGGFFESANHLCGFLTAAALPLLGVAVLGRGVHTLLRLICAVLYLAAAAGVALSTSRGGAGAFGGASLIFAVITAVLLLAGRRHRQNGGTSVKLWLGALVAGLVITVIPTVYVLRHHFSPERITDLNGRGVMWDAALEQWQQYPVIGSGARSYEYMERGYRTLATRWPVWAGEVDARYAHNDYLQALGDYGLVGLGLALLALAAHGAQAIRVLARQQRVDPATRPWLGSAISLGALAALAGLCIQAGVEFNFHIGVNVVMAAGLLGIIANPGPLTGEPAAEPAGFRPGFSPWRFAGTLLAAGLSGILLVKAVPLAQGDFHFMKGERQITRQDMKLEEILTAMGTLQKAVEKDPENPVAWRYWGQANLAVGTRLGGAFSRPFYEKALDQLSRSHALDPYNPYTSAHAGQVADYLRKFDVADGFHRAALQWGQNIQRVNHHYGDHLLLTGKYYEAIGYLLNALHLSGDPGLREEIAEKINLCRERLNSAGRTAPPEAYSTPVPEKPGPAR